MVNIWLDDLRLPPDGWLWAKTADECNDFLLQFAGSVEILSLDHDLGDDEVFGTGYSVCKFLMHRDELFPRKIYLHTANPVGRENMYGLLINYTQFFDIKSSIFRGPDVGSWEESMRKCKEAGDF